MGKRTFRVLFLVISAVMAILMFSSPFMTQAGAFINLDGTPAMMDHTDLWSKQNPLVAFAYGFGDFFCHQQTARSYILNDSQMPICVRDVGLLIGFLLTSVALLIWDRKVSLDRNLKIFSIASFILIIADWAIQHIFDLNVPITRLITGLLAGSAICLLLIYYFERPYYLEECERQGQ